MTMVAKPWIAFHRPNPQARLRLFCFPYAGGGASIFRTWVQAFPAEVEVCAVQLPGRESRLRDEPFKNIEALAEALGKALAPFLDDKPFAFFGHSMGASISYFLSLWLRDQGRPGPQALLVSARRAPQLPSEDEPIYHLPEEEFKNELRELNGTPETVLEHPELMELMLPLLRADFELVDTTPVIRAEPLECPVVAYGGLRDEEVRKDQLEPWQEVSRGPFRLRMFPGDHFFLHPDQDRDALIRALSEDLMRVMPGR